MKEQKIEKTEQVRKAYESPAFKEHNPLESVSAVYYYYTVGA